MDIDLPEFDTMTIGLTLGLWVLFCMFFWFIPGLLGLKEYSLWMKISLTILLLPLSYLICNKILNS